MIASGQLVPELRTIRELFDDSDTVYTVPVYQRNYAWQAEQIEQLIGDIRDALTEGEEGYFLGNLIVTRRKSTITDFEIIDGQQRLTTLYLLLTFLAQDGSAPSGAHRGRLRYESRSRATETLRRIAAESVSPVAPVPAAESAGDEDSGIYQGFNVIEQYMVNQHITGAARGHFADFLREKVSVVRVGLPAKTDVNRYFEVMNTRGQQLQQVDIVKARLMSRLGNEAERECFAWIWDACTDMDAYVQMSLTRGNTRQRGKIFGETWTWLDLGSFQELLEIHGSADIDSASTDLEGGSLALDEALAKYAATGLPNADEDPNKARFRSTIDFSVFLLNVLKVKNRDVEEDESHLDDKRLVRRFEDILRSEGARWVRDFAFELLRCRNLFDNCVLKRQYTATNGDDGDWSLQRFVKLGSSNRITPGYVNTFSRVRADAEEDGGADSPPTDLLSLQSMLRVTYTSPRTMHWITRLLLPLARSVPGVISEDLLAGELRGYAREKVREAYFRREEPTGFAISRIVFTYLDYLLDHEMRMPDFRFSFRNSIEHFYPQHPDEEQSGLRTVHEPFLDRLGNLALVSVGANSKFSNSLPKAKAENYSATIETQSPKLRKMADITRRGGWDDDRVRTHHEEMVELLRRDLELQ